MKHTQFKNLLDKAYSKAATTNKPIIIRYTQSIPYSVDDILNKMLIQKDMFYMNFPNNKGTYMGIGKSLSYQISSKKELVNLKRNKYIVINNKRKDLLNFFGGAAFDIESKSFYPWKNIPKGEFFIPKLLIQKTSSTTSLLYTRLIDKNILKTSILKDYKRYYLLINNKTETITEGNISIKLKSQSPRYKTYLKNIYNIVDRFANNSLEKVVISRLVKYTLANNLSIANLIYYLNKRYPRCLNFFISFNKNNIFIGSTPEKLIQINNTSFTIDAIAGSCPNKKNLYNTKEISEHNYVIRYIKHKMEKISSHITIPKKPSILQLHYIYHLYTFISGKLKNKTHILELLEKLYPTPALLGNPSDNAMRSINLYEKTDRGWYGGCIGIYNENGDGQFYVPIRSGLIKNNNFLLFTGSGIISESIPQKEWEETVLKLEHILSYFNKD